MLVALARLVTSEEAVVDMWPHLRLDTDACITDADRGARSLACHGDTHLTAGWGVLNGVVQQDQQQLANLSWIGHDHLRLQALDADLDAALASRLKLHAGVAEDVEGQLVQLHRLATPTE